MVWQRLIRGILIGVPAFTVSGCLGYYAQSVRGQLDIMRRAEPIAEVIGDPSVAAATRSRLEWVSRVRRFASEELGLPDNGSFTKFADLERPYAVWVVFAAPPLSLTPLQWCFPVAGCVNYRGYFTRSGAERFAQGLARDGYDVHVSGVPAYSTLGWFEDPVLNTVMRYSDEQLAGLIFHELAHQVAYVQDDSTFNESFATAVERIGVRRWLASTDAEDRIARYELENYRNSRVVRLIELYRSRLDLLYTGAGSAAFKQERKRELLGELKTQYRALVRYWPDYREFSVWFDQSLNNAKLASVSVYYGLAPEFERLFRQLGRDLPRFYGEVTRLARMPKSARDQALRANSTDG